MPQKLALRCIVYTLRLICLFYSEYSFTYDTLSRHALYPRHKLHSRWVTPRPHCLWSSMWFSLWVCTLPSLFPHPRFILFVCLLSFFLVTKVNKVPGVLEIHTNGLISSSHAMLSIPIHIARPLQSRGWMAGVRFAASTEMPQSSLFFVLFCFFFLFFTYTDILSVSGSWGSVPPSLVWCAINPNGNLSRRSRAGDNLFRTDRRAICHSL